MRSKNLLMAMVILITIYLSPTALCQEGKKAAARVKNGTWSGTTSLGNEISFEVKDYKIVGLNFPVNHSCGERTKVSGSLYFPEIDIGIARASGTFRIRNWKIEDVGLTVTIQGRFRTKDAIGTLVIAGLCTPPAKITWTATYE